ncbi:DUF1643 domain-containing protein [Levilactobacillus tujiorum]|uniref:DUF1643 domain-containing protein n=1 Tax=Levilactobacillus tujiorum TaxID=2912243 RepID=UPI00145752C4|nr:DUF1643 domain-containing protein [Levilactobacillus tujiorum]NLR33146.1 DUF1643 domain-containing protein [Levilactobacillus tujiorum]
MCKYSNLVDQQNINCTPEGEDYRYKLQIQLINQVGGTREAIVLMMNPSKADAGKSDPTTNELLMYRKYNKFTIFNVLPFRGQPHELLSKHSSKLNSEDAHVKKNLKSIIDYVNKAQNVDIVFATGDLTNNTKIKNTTECDTRKLREPFQDQYNKICQVLSNPKYSNRIFAVTNCGQKINYFGRHPSRNGFDIQRVKIEKARGKFKYKLIVI